MNRDAHLAGILDLLHDYGPRLADGLPVKWHVEHHESRHYAITALLVLVDANAIEDELGVVAVHARTQPAVRWNVDATGPEGVIVAALELPDDREHQAMAADPKKAVAVIGAFLETSVPAIRTSVARYLD